MPDSKLVEIVYALPDRQRVVCIDLTPGLTAMAAVEASGLLTEFPQLSRRRLDFGVFGRKVAPDHVLAAGDRVEILRPLLADPRETRRKLAAIGETMGKR